MYLKKPDLSMIARTSLLALTLLLAGCDIAALLADPKVAQREADAKAIGGACRNGLRAIEDCYALNEKASKAAIYAGWREMDQYMRDNKIEGVAPVGSKPSAPEEVITESKSAQDVPKTMSQAKSTDKADKTAKQDAGH
ncbi:MAG: hypothetical protein KGN32_16450 [Burkholderiales bacterium]|nr:hypothetical protein [Burkholderiales bacterium]